MNNRITSIDILRGITICGMILVNNPGGGEENAYAPLLHAEWIGLTPTDLVFPFFMFIMGITTYLSLKKYNFEWSGRTALKIIRRGLTLWAIGLAITWLIMMTRGFLNGDYTVFGILDHIRILGVMPRLGICYGIASIIAISIRHRYIPYLIATIFIAYFIILACGNGFAHDETNIIDIVDKAIFGPQHVYKWESPDPEALLSTLPSIAHVLIGFCVGKMLSTTKGLDSKIQQLFVAGAIMTFCGFLLAYGCPLSKKLWTPTFALTTCGLASTLLALLSVLLDKKNFNSFAVTFFKVFGMNSLAMFVISDLMLIPFSILPIIDGNTIQETIYTSCTAILPNEAASLVWTILFILINWGIGYILYKKNIYIKL